VFKCGKLEPKRMRLIFFWRYSVRSFFFFFFNNRIVSSKDHEWKERKREKKDSHTHAGEQQEEVLVFYFFGKLLQSDLQTTSEISEYLCDELLFAMILDTAP
jgi:hypothetical protein